MGFRQGAYCRIWSVENKGNYSTARITISRLDKSTGTYTTDFQDGFVRLVGQAHTAFKDIKIDEKKGITAKISSCEVTNVYTSPDGKVSNTPHYAIFGVEIDGGDNRKSDDDNTKTNKDDSNEYVKVPDDIDDTELPFN